MTRSVAMLSVLIAGCAAVPDPGAGEACRSVFTEFVGRAPDCGLEPSVPDVDAVCELAYSYDDYELHERCLPWIRGAACDELHNAQFQAFCGKAIHLKTW